MKQKEAKDAYMQRQVSKDLEPELAKLRDEFNDIAAAPPPTAADPPSKSTQPIQPNSAVEVKVTPATPAQEPAPAPTQPVLAVVAQPAAPVAAPIFPIISQAVTSDSVPQTPEVWDVE